MSHDIVIVREGDGYRLLHGHLHLANELGLHGEIDVEVPGEGKISIVRVRNDYAVHRDGKRLPLYRQ
jgi:hypothetical protein